MNKRLVKKSDVLRICICLVGLPFSLAKLSIKWDMLLLHLEFFHNGPETSFQGPFDKVN